MSDSPIEMPLFTLQERDARWGRVRAAMAARGLSALIVYPHSGHNQQWEADARYLTQVGGGGSSTACVFPIEGDVTVFALNRPDFWARAQNWVTDVRTSDRFNWSNPILKRLKELGIDRDKVGISSLRGNLRAREGTITLAQWEALTAAFPNAQFEDVSLMMGELRAVKSAEELATMQHATEITELGIKAMVEAARPGVRDYEVFAALQYGMLRAGGELPSMVIYGSGPAPHPGDAFVPTHRILQPGDMIDNEIEGKFMGYSAQRVQPVVLGEPPAGLLEAMGHQRTVFNAALVQLKPGIVFGDVAKLVDEVAASLNCKVSLTMHGRGIGEDRPMLVGGAMTDEAASYVLQEGNCFILKPRVQPAGGPGIIWGDTVKVTPSGGQRLGKDEHQLVSVA